MIKKTVVHLSRFALVSIGLICVGLGVAGIVLPLLPTTPFLLLAAACFARSSPRFHRWLLNHRFFGPPIRNWQQHRCISPTMKRYTTVVILLSFGASMLLVDILAVRLLLLLLMTVLLIFIWRTNDAPRADAGEPSGSKLP